LPINRCRTERAATSSSGVGGSVGIVTVDIASYRYVLAYVQTTNLKEKKESK
jgi:hypothetical protein